MSPVRLLIVLSRVVITSGKIIAISGHDEHQSARAP